MKAKEDTSKILSMSTLHLSQIIWPENINASLIDPANLHQLVEKTSCTHSNSQMHLTIAVVENLYGKKVLEHVTWALMNRSISASSRWTSRERSSSSIGSRSSGESPEEFPAPLPPPPWRRSSRESARPVDTAEPVCRKSIDDICEFSPSSSCSLGCLHPIPAAAVIPTGSTTTQNRAKYLKNQRLLQQNYERRNGDSRRKVYAVAVQPDQGRRAAG